MASRSDMDAAGPRAIRRTWQGIVLLVGIAVVIALVWRPHDSGTEAAGPGGHYVIDVRSGTVEDGRRIVLEGVGSTVEVYDNWSSSPKATMPIDEFLAGLGDGDRGRGLLEHVELETTAPSSSLPEHWNIVLRSPSYDPASATIRADFSYREDLSLASSNEAPAAFGRAALYLFDE